MSVVYHVSVPLADMQHGVIPAGVFGLPGLSNVRCGGGVAVLAFGTAQGCDPAGAQFVASEVERMGARVLSVREAPERRKGSS